jgi:hypothetical protein
MEISVYSGKMPTPTDPIPERARKRGRILTLNPLRMK